MMANNNNNLLCAQRPGGASERARLDGQRRHIGHERVAHRCSVHAVQHSSRQVSAAEGLSSIGTSNSKAYE